MIPEKGFQSSVDFPEPRETFAEGLVAIGGRVDVGTLYHAYRRGIFPWPQENLPMLWFSPEQRGVLFFDQLRVPRSLQRSQRRTPDLRLTLDQAFVEVVEACRLQKRPGQAGTWILPEMVEAYRRFHEAGFAHSVEVWRGDNLVGGVYGVFVEGVFSGESMFHRETDASKKALLFLIDHLRQRGVQWMDTQMVTPVVAALGGTLIPRDQFLRLMKESQRAWNAPGVADGRRSF